MALDKADLKIALFEGLGTDFDDRQEKAEQEIYKVQGAAAAFQKSCEELQALIAKVNADVEVGKLDLEDGKAIIGYIQMGSSQLHKLMIGSRNQAFVCQGRQQGLLDVVKHIRQQQDVEEGKKALRAREEAEEEAENQEEAAPPAEPEPRVKLRKTIPKASPKNGSVPKRKKMRSKKASASNAR